MPNRGRQLAAGAIVLLFAIVVAAVLFFQRRRVSLRETDSATNGTMESEATVFASYAGSASCQSCHAEEFTSWRGSHHGLAERVPSPGLDRAAFVPMRTFQHGSQHTTVSERNGRFEINALRSNNGYESLPVERVIGVAPLRQYLINLGNGRSQATEAVYDPRRDDWFNVYGKEDRQPGEWGHWTGRGMNWNSMCASCHNTRVRKNYDQSSDSYHTTMAEPTVSCEACHGPLKSHVDWQKRYGKSGKKDSTISKLTKEQTMENCAFCHARRGDLTGDFKPGDSFLDHMRLAVVDYTDAFYPDGQVRDEDYEYTAFLGSRMHARGVWCMDCHDQHTGKTRLPGNWLCMRCHSGSDQNAPVINPVTHSFHKVFGYDAKGVATNLDLTSYKVDQIKETGGECVNCHMPQTVYMQRHARHDHGFTIPDPLLTKQFGIPNACNRCHQDKDADWAIDWTNKWYSEKMNRPSRQRAQTIATARAGDAGARNGLLAALAKEEIPYWRAVESGMLAPWVGERPVRDALLRAATDNDPLVRETSVRSLEPLVANDATTAQAIVERLEDPIRGVRVAAAWSLRAQLDEASRAGKDLLWSLNLNSDQPAGQMQQGAYVLARKDPEKAVQHYHRAVKWDSNSAAIHRDYAVLLSTLNRSQEAVQELEAACRLEPNNAEIQYDLALAWNEVGNSEKAIEGLQAAVRLDPKLSRAWYNLGLALNAAGRIEEALQSLSTAEAIESSDPRIPYARATILAQAGRTEEARRAAERAIEINPNFTPASELLQKLH